MISFNKYTPPSNQRFVCVTQMRSTYNALIAMDGYRYTRVYCHPLFVSGGIHYVGRVLVEVYKHFMVEMSTLFALWVSRYSTSKDKESILLCKAKRQYLLTLQVSRFCLLSSLSWFLLKKTIRINYLLLVTCRFNPF